MSVKNKLLGCLAISMGLVGILCTGLWLVTQHLDDFQDDFLNAVYAGDIKEVETMLIAGQNPNKRDGYGNNPMTLAAYAGHSDILKLLLKHGAMIDSQDDSGMTPLHCAAYFNRIETGRLLLKEHAEVDIKNRYGYTPLSEAVSKGYLSMATELLNAGADVSSPDKHGWQPIHQVLRSEGIDPMTRFQVVALLLDHGADPNAVNPGGWQEDSKHDSAVGFRWPQLPNRGNTPLAIADNNGFTEIADLLKKHGAK